MSGGNGKAEIEKYGTHSRKQVKTTKRRLSMKKKINYKILKRLKKLSVQEIDKILIENKKRINSTNPKGERKE